MNGWKRVDRAPKDKGERGTPHVTDACPSSWLDDSPLSRAIAEAEEVNGELANAWPRLHPSGEAYERKLNERTRTAIHALIEAAREAEERVRTLEKARWPDEQ